MRRGRRRLIIALLLGVGLTSAAAPNVLFAKPGVVRTREGQTYDGEVDEKDPDTVVVNVRGIETRIARDRIASIDYTARTQTDFNDRLAKLAPNDVQGRLAIARQAFDQKQYAVARQAAEQAREIDPNNADVVALLGTIQSQMRLERARGQGVAEATRPAPATNEAASQPAGNERLLKPTDINVIRQAELRPTDAGVRIRFDRDVKKRYIAYAAIPPADFYNAMTVNDQVQEILTHGTPEMRRDIAVLSDPPALFQYRRQIQPFLVANCATSGCHGGASGAAKFHLVTPAESELASYTNFYILQNYTKAMRAEGGVFGKGDLRMIDRQQADRSLLLQYALPGAMAEYDHPDVPGYKPAVRGVNDARYRQILEWIGGTLKPVQDDPTYGINYPIQGSSSASTQPGSAASMPAAASQPVAPAATPPPPRGPGNVRLPPTTRPVGTAPRTGTMPR